ncbi:hypothetical protein C943_01337 [Mariniradius saccharolyticus AK6]|uniref:Uncharacterized protein n=1 Tax=Mariniradius saccharolyticus AK6 TaxID=1239962 RepID=M7X3L2_9BACT|nr:hypothetical protein [Mariniradius saccharolyticus]EMS32075.1 hypothetical protein C943_01337 [Mariniradius saccharolyticus AK6]
MKKPRKISLLFDPSKSITVNYSLYPIFKSKLADEFSFIDSRKYDIRKDTNEHLVVFAKYFGNLSPDEQSSLIEKAKNKYQKVCFFDDLDGSEIQFFKYFDDFDLYFKKQIYSDLSSYTRRFNGNKLFIDFYRSRFEFEIKSNSKYDGQYLGDSKNLGKIRLCWNIGIGDYFSNRSKLIRILFPIVGPNIIGKLMGNFPSAPGNDVQRIKKCQARFGVNERRKHIDIQRKILLEKVDGNDMFLSGKLDPKLYQKEIRKISAVLSPFGYGEVCFRDFEAILNSAVLVKPDMSHLNTWPNVFKPMETFLPIAWDGSNLISQVQDLLTNEKLAKDLSRNAYQELSLSFGQIDEKVKEFKTLILE